MTYKSATTEFIETRDALLGLRSNSTAACSSMRWPRLETFNWVENYFSVIASNNDSVALRVVDDAGADESFTFAQLSRRSSQVANFLEKLGISRGCRVMLMLGNVPALWESMLAAIRLGAIIVPASTMLQGEDLRNRLDRGEIKAVITHSVLVDKFQDLDRAAIRVCVGQIRDGWIDFDGSVNSSETFRPNRPTRADELLFLYFTSGTTEQPKLVAHTHMSYPIGHLSTMYWLGVRPGDVHMNVSSPGWAKHAWSSFFAPWNAQATVLAYQYERFDAEALLNQLVRCKVTTFCAPPTVWRMLINLNLEKWKIELREAVSAGEPLNPEVIDRVRDAWHITVRDGFGQTETTAQIGNCPGEHIKVGSMGRPLPGCPVVLLGPDSRVAEEGEICIELAQSPIGLMTAYWEDEERTAAAMRGGYYHTGDIASRDADGYLTYVGRMDDVFKSSDYRISPFELESVLIEHPAIMEAAVVPSPDAVRLSVPKAIVTLAEGHQPIAATARSILDYVRSRVSPYKRVRRIQFADLPKTVSGKIRRAQLRQREFHRDLTVRLPMEFWEEDMKDTHNHQQSD